MSHSVFTPYYITSQYPPEKLTQQPAYWFIFRNHELLILDQSNEMVLPLVNSLAELGLEALQQHFFGTLQGYPCYAVNIAEGTKVNTPYRFLGLRPLATVLDSVFFAVAGRAFQLLFWDKTHQFCSRCATPLVLDSQEKAKQCPSCQLRFYPRISPAIIVCIQRGNQILLSRSPHHTKGMYTVQAGFIEAGESAEEAVHREVREEVGLKLKNVRYFGSQAWAFPHSLMLAFIAEYASGELTVNKDELEDAYWCDADKLPAILPPSVSIARHLLEDFAAQWRE